MTKIIINLQFEDSLDKKILLKKNIKDWLEQAFDIYKLKQIEAIKSNSTNKLIDIARINLNIRFTSLKEITYLNAVYRNKFYPTNILTFNYFNLKPKGKKIIYADLIICAYVVRNEAKNLKKDLLEHYAFLCIHGFYHALGLDHVEEIEALYMEDLEKRTLISLGYKNPYLNL